MTLPYDTIGDMVIDEYVGEVSDDGRRWRKVVEGETRWKVHDQLDAVDGRYKRLLTHKVKVIWTNNRTGEDRY